jgi:hypothetical protein
VTNAWASAGWTRPIRSEMIPLGMDRFELGVPPDVHGPHLFKGKAAPEAGDDGSMMARGRIRWYDDGVVRDWPGKWRISFREGLTASVTAEHDADGDPTGPPSPRCPAPARAPRAS